MQPALRRAINRALDFARPEDLRRYRRAGPEIEPLRSGPAPAPAPEPRAGKIWREPVVSVPVPEMRPDPGIARSVYASLYRTRRDQVPVPYAALAVSNAKLRVVRKPHRQGLFGKTVAAPWKGFC